MGFVLFVVSALVSAQCPVRSWRTWTTVRIAYHSGSHPQALAQMIDLAKLHRGTCQVPVQTGLSGQLSASCYRSPWNGHGTRRCGSKSLMAHIHSCQRNVTTGSYGFLPPENPYAMCARSMSFMSLLLPPGSSEGLHAAGWRVWTLSTEPKASMSAAAVQAPYVCWYGPIPATAHAPYLANASARLS